METSALDSIGWEVVQKTLYLTRSIQQ